MGCGLARSAKKPEEPDEDDEEDEPEPPMGKFAKINPTVTATRTKFETGKVVVAEIPHAEGPPLDEFRGLTGTVMGMEKTPDGRFYEVSFDMSRQVQLGTAICVKDRNGKIIYGPDEDQEFIVQFDDSGEYSDCLKLEDLTFPGRGDDKRTAKVPEEFLRTAGTVAKSTNVQYLTLAEIFKACQVHVIPVFQRRYCWTERQCSRLWDSALKMQGATSEVNNHSMGRLMLLQQANGTRLVLDGQQRLTTLTLLFAALRDRLSLLGEELAAEEVSELCKSGRLVPTLDDQHDFERCLHEPCPDGEGALMTAKRCFAERAKALSSEDCKGLTQAVQKRLSLIAFILEDERSMQRVYENLAKRVITLDEARRMGVDLSTCHECHVEGKQTPSTHWGPDGHRLCEKHASAVGLDMCEAMTPGIEMSPVDLIRNFVVEHYRDEASMRKAHAEYWSPLEKTAGGRSEGLEQLLKTFLEAQGFHIKHRWYLFSAFTVWWRNGKKLELNSEATANSKLQELSAAVRSKLQQE
eukprot:TRINITY_DN60692_c0_g1_i1.p1 TRINITY_DN60692_c0_g1~~TRINITY_DN60692_c0_g1_i1.p1  ORF type:complete len:523 (-),score=113.11 TRINITY_DN60692_c0_g1_i1:25-1593(-)